MKWAWIYCVLCLICLHTQAGIYHKRDINNPCFVTSNTSRIEFKRLILTEEQTQADAVFYGTLGEAIGYVHSMEKKYIRVWIWHVEIIRYMQYLMVK